ncbi:MAG: peptide-methionine (S)-S-oxide reductase MsrA [Alphaproteobacteria bacterium]|nr:peptide-methionine (S)-S-oxide reductase MsrA [Alphaproteobacteria bacterium]
MSLLSTTTSAATKTETAIFAAGCFWCIEPPFDNAEGVVKTTVGYTGGHIENPTYDDVTSKKSGHYEAIEVVYDPAVISYAQILDIFWQNIDPTDAGGQFYDRGQSYQTAIFIADAAQEKIAHASLEKTAKAIGKPIATKILPAAPFYPAEDYHQEYYKKNKLHYNAYKTGSGREEKIKKLWEK